jgi:putative membrane protein
MYYDHYGNNGMMDGFGWIFMLIMMAFLFLAVVLIFRHLSQASAPGQKEDTALELLKNRYAKGEIEKKEFDEKRKDLKAL